MSSWTELLRAGRHRGLRLVEVLPHFNELLSTAEQKYFSPLQIKGKIPQPKKLLLVVMLKKFLHPLPSAKAQYSCVHLRPVQH